MSCKVASPPNRRVCRAVCTSAVTIPERMSAIFKVRLVLEPVPVEESAEAGSVDMNRCVKKLNIQNVIKSTSNPESVDLSNTSNSQIK